MKKQWLPLVFAVFLMLAPVVRAEDDSAAGAFEQLIAQIVDIILGHDEAELGELWPLNGASAQPGDEPEIGDLAPPWG